MPPCSESSAPSYQKPGAFSRTRFSSLFSHFKINTLLKKKKKNSMLQVKVGPNSVSPNPCVSSAQATASETLFELRLCPVATWPSFSSPISVLDVSFLLNGTARPDHTIENCTFLLIPLSCFIVLFPQSADHLWGGLTPSTSYLFTIFIVYCLHLLAGPEVPQRHGFLSYFLL